MILQKHTIQTVPAAGVAGLPYVLIIMHSPRQHVRTPDAALTDQGSSRATPLMLALWCHSTLPAARAPTHLFPTLANYNAILHS